MPMLNVIIASKIQGELLLLKKRRKKKQKPRETKKDMRVSKMYFKTMVIIGNFFFKLANKRYVLW